MATNTNYTDTNDKPHRLMDSLSYMIGKDGTNMASATNPVPVDAIVTVDSMNIEAEMKTVSGHDLYKVPGTITVTGNLAVSFGAVTGLNLQDLQSFEDKTKSWVYNLKGATVSTTTISLVAGNQNTGYPNLTNGDAIEIVYRGASRLTDKTQMTQITDGTTEATVQADIDEVESEASNGLQTSSAIYGFDSEATATNKLKAVQVAIDNAGVSATPNVLVGGGIYKAALDTYDDNDAVPLHFTANGKLLTDAEITFNDYTDDSDEFTVATSKMLAIGGVATTDEVDAGDVGSFAMSIKRELLTKDKLWDGTTEVDVLPNTAAVDSTGKLGIASEVVDFNTAVGEDFTGAIGILGESPAGAKALHIEIDDSAMDATPPFLPVGGEYRASATTYTDGDATVLQTDVNGNLRVAQTNTEYVDDSNGFTAASSKGNAVMGLATSDLVDAGDVGALRMTVNRNLGVDVSEQSLTAMKVSATAAANVVTNPIFTAIGDGTTTVVVETAGTKKAANVNITDGTNDMPTMDATARPGYVKLTDGTSDLTLGTGTVKTLPVEISDGSTGVDVIATINSIKADISSVAGSTTPVSQTDGLLVNLGSNNDVTVTGTVTAIAGGTINTAGKGTVGSALVLTPASGTKQAFDFIVNAPQCTDDATLVILRDAVTIFNGYMGNRDGDGAIRFPAGDTAATTTWTVTVTGGTGDVFACVRHN